jgi:AcrR family transcriptional regulator
MTEKAKAKAAKIEEVARKLFAEHGYTNITIDDVANAVGMARTTLYDYFKSKEEILYALVERNLVFSLETPPPGPLAARLQDAMAGSIGRLRRGFDLYRILFAERPVLGGELGEKLGSWQRRLLDTVRGIIEEAAAAGEYAPRGGVDGAMFAYQAVLSHYLNRALMAGDPRLLGRDEHDEAGRLVELMLYGTGGC